MFVTIKDGYIDEEAYKAKFVAQGRLYIMKDSLVYNISVKRQRSIKINLAIADIFDF